MSREIIIFDTTLRDGEQSPGVNLNLGEKLEIAKQLARLNVDVIEAGFPIASPGDFESVKAIAKEVKGPVIAGLARSVKKDIDRAWEALQYAERPRIHVFIATSDIHMQYKLRKSPEEVLQLAVESVKYAKSLCSDIEFSAEDATRSNWEFLCKVIEAAIDAGATTVNIPDTVGYTVPWEFEALIRHIISNVRNIDKARISVHCHNDLGMAVANTLAALKAGATQAECTVNGIGERAGNAALEEVVMALRTRNDFFDLKPNIITEQIYRTSSIVSALTGIQVQANKAIVGPNAFAHESGIHQDGVLKERSTYEIMTPQSIGLTQNRIVLGKHSGRHAFRERLKEMGYSLTDEELNRVFERFIELADKKKELHDQDIEALVQGQIGDAEDIFELDYLHVSSGITSIPTATVRIKKEGEVFEEAACGEGPVDAVYKAIDRITGIAVNLADYSLRAVTGGKDALGEVSVRVRDNGKVYTGRGVSMDIIEASARAYIHALNKMVHDRKRASENKSEVEE